QGDLPGARAAVQGAAARIDPEVVLAFISNFQVLYWVLDDEDQRRTLALPQTAFGDRSAWAIVHTELYALRHDRASTMAYADSARLALEEQIRASPEDGQRHSLLGVVLAYAGRKSDAIREARRGVEMLPISKDAYIGGYLQLQLVRTYILVGEPEQALDQLEPLLKTPFYLSPGWLRVDPT